MELLVSKSFVQSHSRTLKSGKVVQVAAHSDKRTKKAEGMSLSNAANWYQDYGFQPINDHARGLVEITDETLKAKIADATQKLDAAIADQPVKGFYAYRGDSAEIGSLLFNQTGIASELKNVNIRTADHYFDKKPPSGKSWEDYFTSKLKGCEFHDKGFVSTSVDKDVVMDKFVHGGGEISQYGALGLVEIMGKNVKSLKMDDYSGMGAKEGELLLARGTTFVIDRVDIGFGDNGLFLKYQVKIKGAYDEA